MRILTYDLTKYDFPQAIRDLLGEDNLETLTAGTEPEANHSIYKNMEQTRHYSLLAEALADPERARPFADLYARFVAERIAPEYDEEILYQARPTIRLLYADAGGESRFHRDRDYGHDTDEVNYTLAVTPAFDSNAIWIENAEGAEDFAPMELQPGELAEFDGASLKHGAKQNETGRTRISFDFRVIPVSRAKGRTVSAGWPTEPDAHRFISVQPPKPGAP